jgi:hypothetical protein
LCIPFPRLETLLPLPFFLSRGDFAILKELAEAEWSYGGPGGQTRSMMIDPKKAISNLKHGRCCGNVLLLLLVGDQNFN